MKKIASLILALCMVLSLTACGSSSAPTTTAAPANNAAAAEYTFNLGTNTVEGDIPYYLASYFKEAVEEKSEGKVTVNIYPAGQLGGDDEMIQNIKSGMQDFYTGNLAQVNPYCVQAAVMDEYFAFDDIEHFRRFIDSGFIDVLNEYMKENDMRIIGMAEVGMQQLMSNRPIRSLEDLSGLKIRVLQNKYRLTAWKALGAAPTPMDWGEVYVGLQQKTIDAVEQPFFFICSSKLYEVQDYMLLTNHVAQPAILLMNEDMMQTLPQDIQDLLIECAQQATVKTRSVVDDMMADRLQEIIDNGVEVTEPSDELFAQFRELAHAETELIIEDVGEEFYNLFAEYRDSTR